MLLWLLLTHDGNAESHMIATKMNNAHLVLQCTNHSYAGCVNSASLVLLRIVIVM